MTKLLKTSALIVSVLSFSVIGAILINNFVLAQSTAIVVGGVTYDTVEEALKNAPSYERATIKGREIAKIKTIPKIRRGDYYIEVLDINAMENGFEMFVKAWDSNNQPIGFGTDGTVEIERIISINPPILVDDPNGTIVREWQEIDSITKQVTNKTRTLREDLREALLLDLQHTLSVKRQKFPGENIIPGKVGNTTATMRPVAGANSPVDGEIERDGSSESWTTVRNDTTGSAASVTGLSSTQAVSSKSGADFYVQRSVFLFDGSTIGTDHVDSATFTLYGNGTAENNGDTTNTILVGATPANNNNLVTTDYDDFNTTEYATFTTGNWNQAGGAANDWSINATGLTKIESDVAVASSIIKFGLRNSRDVNNSEPTGLNNINSYFADQDGAGTTNDPKLVVEHSAVSISNLLASDITSSSAVITWTTNVVADSEVRYGTTTPVSSSNPVLTQSDAATTTSHSLTLINLDDSTTYYYVASSTDGSFFATSTEGSFTTLAGSTLFAHKAQDQATSSQSTLFVDDELFIELAANKSYVVTAAIAASSTASQPDINMAFNVPDGASMALTFGSFDGSSQVAGSGLFSTTTSEVSIDLPATGLVVMHISGVITTATTTGNVQFKWAQRTSNATEIKVFKGSYLRAEEITL